MTPFGDIIKNIEHYILYKQRVEITYQGTSGRMWQERGFIKDLFFQKGRKLILLETGLPIEIDKIKLVKAI